MSLPGGIGEIYLICTATGVIYFGFGILLGQLQGLTHAHTGHAPTDSHADFSGHGDHQIAHPQGGHHLGHDTQVAGDSSSGHGPGPHHAAGHSGSSADDHSHVLHPPHSAGDRQSADIASTGSHEALHPHPRSWLHKVLGLLNPMTIAIFATFFGLAGLILLAALPGLQMLSSIPAALISGFITARLLGLFAWLLFQASASSEAKVENLIGQMAQISVPIKDGKVGEITCVMESKRYNYPARAVVPGNAFATASMVVICDLRGGVAYVEPWTDLILQTEEGAILEVPPVRAEKQTKPVD